MSPKVRKLFLITLDPKIPKKNGKNSKKFFRNFKNQFYETYRFLAVNFFRHALGDSLIHKFFFGFSLFGQFSGTMTESSDIVLHFLKVNLLLVVNFHLGLVLLLLCLAEGVVVAGVRPITKFKKHENFELFLENGIK